MPNKMLPALLFLIAFLVGADELLLGPILQPIGQDLGVPAERITLFITAYSLAIAFIAPYFGRLSDQWGRLRIMLPACVLFGLSSIATGLVGQFDVGLLTRVMTGLASAGMLPIAFALAGDQPGDKAMKHITLVQAGLTLGMITSPAIGAFLTEWLSWRAAFIVLGAAALMVAALLAAQGGAHYAKNKTAKPEQPAMAQLLRIPGARGALLAMGLGLGGGIGVFNLVGQRLRDATELDIALVGLTYAVLGGVSVMGNMVMSRAIRRLGSGRAVMRAALVVCLLCSAWVFGASATHVLMFLPVLFFWSLAGGIGSPALQSHIAQLSDSHRGTLMALGMSMMHLGVAIWSGLAGFAYSLGAVWLAVLAVGLFAAAIAALKPIPVSEAD
ncbi:MFS transporter [Vibrio proteolyticus]|mgnify:CR=1 FL=1